MFQRVGGIHHRRGRLALLGGAALALVSGAPSAAAATAPASGTVYGGSTSQGAPFAVTLTADRRRLARAMFQVDARCSDGDTSPYFANARFRPGPAPKGARTDVFAGQRLSGTGGFSFRGVATRARGATTFRVTHRLSGTIRKARATGTLRTTIEVVDRTGAKRGSCATKTLRWTAVSAPGRVFAGVTVAGGPVVMALNSTRRQIYAFRIGWVSGCTAGGFFGLADELSEVTVRRDGSFKDGLEQSEPTDGGQRRTTITLQGKAGRTRASGMYRRIETDRDKAGKTTDTCDSGALRWSLRSG
jgi:hypothetical protein